jgi:hypothetical protein
MGVQSRYWADSSKESYLSNTERMRVLTQGEEPLPSKHKGSEFKTQDHQKQKNPQNPTEQQQNPVCSLGK